MVESIVSRESFEPVDAWRNTRVLYVSQQLVCVTTSEADDGSLAGTTVRETWNFVRGGFGFRRYELAELFRPGSPWEERLVAFCEEAVKRQTPTGRTGERFRWSSCAVLP